MTVRGTSAIVVNGLARADEPPRQAHDDRLGRTGWLDRASKPERNANFYSENTDGALGVPLSASAGSNPTTPAMQCDLNGAGSAFWKVRDIPDG